MMRRTVFEPDHEALRESVGRFLDDEIVPRYADWEVEGIIPREAIARAAELGFYGMSVDESHGGAGTADFRFNAIVNEEVQRRGLTAYALALTITSDVTLPYLIELTTTGQRERWLPGIASGRTVTAIAMTEPGTGSDLAAIRTTARRVGDGYLVNGAKTFVTNGINADLVLLAVRTGSTGTYRDISMLVVERDTPGFTRGRRLQKLGQHAQDTAELFFEDAHVPAENLVGREGAGFAAMTRNLAQERLSIAVGAVAAARGALEGTLDYVGDRQAFGRPVGTFQHSRFKLAECHTEVEVAQAFVDRCLSAHLTGDLAAEEAAMAKWWTTEMLGRVTDACLQLHGGYGYMTEYPIARAFADARVARIYGGANEIMKEIIGRSIGLADVH